MLFKYEGVEFYKNDNPAKALRRFLSTGTSRLPLEQMYTHLHVISTRLLPARICDVRGLLPDACSELKVESCQRRKSTWPGYEFTKMKHLSNEEKLAILFRYAKEAGGEAMCVETGTYMGDTTLALFQEPGICGGGVLTVELGEELAYNARSRFDESGAEAIQILQGDSKTALHQHSEVRMDCNASKSERNKKNFIFI